VTKRDTGREAWPLIRGALGLPGRTGVGDTVRLTPRRSGADRRNGGGGQRGNGRLAQPVIAVSAPERSLSERDPSQTAITRIGPRWTVCRPAHLELGSAAAGRRT